MSGYGKPDDDADNAQALVDNAISLARSRLPQGEGTPMCVECGDTIPEARRKALPGVCRCISCQEVEDNRKIRIRVVDHIL